MSRRFLAIVTMATSLAGCRDATPSEPEPAATVKLPAPPAEPAPDAPTAKDWNYPTIKWRSLDYGLAQMRSQKRPGVVVVMATWCPQCDAYKALFRDPQVIELSRHAEMILIDAEKSPERAAEWHTDADYFPRTFFVNPAGSVEPDLVTSNPKFSHFFNAVQRSEFVAALRQAIAKYP
jgi:thiol-disulfide isomerase/thioredoxin